MWLKKYMSAFGDDAVIQVMQSSETKGIMKYMITTYFPNFFSKLPTLFFLTQFS